MDREKARQIKKRFSTTFGHKTGHIEGQYGFPPVTLCGISCSLFSMKERNEAFGCPSGQTAILVEWLPVDPANEKKRWVTFPKKFEGLPVYYKRGNQAFAFES